MPPLLAFMLAAWAWVSAYTVIAITIVITMFAAIADR